jgi:putative flippase GtrA
MAASRNDMGHVVRFLVLGGANTLLTTVVFVLLMMRVPYAAAYVVSFGLGVLINAQLVGRFVFRAPASGRLSAKLAAWSLLMMVIGAGLSALCEWRGLSPLPTAAGIAMVVVPVNFLGARLIVARDSPSVSTHVDQAPSAT